MISLIVKSYLALILSLAGTALFMLVGITTWIYKKYKIKSTSILKNQNLFESPTQAISQTPLLDIIQAHSVDETPVIAAASDIAETSESTWTLTDPMLSAIAGDKL